MSLARFFRPFTLVPDCTGIRSVAFLATWNCEENGAAPTSALRTQRIVPFADYQNSPKLPGIAPEGEVGAGAYEVIDGDTIRAPYGVKYRLLGFAAPETFQTRCDAELALIRRAHRAAERASGVWRGPRR